MQRSEEIKRARSGPGLAAQLDRHWIELSRFVTSRRMRSSVYAGAMRDLSAAQLQALILLAESDLRMSELAARLGVAESTATRLVDRLVATKLVRRRSSQPDRRAVVAELTPSGRRLASELEDSRRQFLSELLATLEPADRREFVALFAKVTSVLRARDTKDERP